MKTKNNKCLVEYVGIDDNINDNEIIINKIVADNYSANVGDYCFICSYPLSNINYIRLCKVAYISEKSNRAYINSNTFKNIGLDCGTGMAMLYSFFNIKADE